MDKKAITGIKKRQQIKNANQTMFLWIIAASVAVAVCLVLGQFMLRQFIFNNKIISAKNQAYDTLRDNKESFGELKNEVNKLVSNQSLSKLKVAESDTSLQVIIDALPTTDDRVALANSLQQVILARSGVAIESITVVDGGTVTTGAASDATTPTPSNAPISVPFTVVVKGNYDQIRQAVGDLEKSIRPMSVDRVLLEGSNNELRATIIAQSHYLPAKSVQVTTESIKP